MARAYSQDLRKLVIKALERGEKVSEVSEAFEISQKTIYNWKNRLKVTGNVQSQSPGPGKGANRKISNLGEFKAFVLNKPDLTLEEFARAWGNVSRDTIRRSMKAIGFSYKKNFWIQRKK